MIKYIIEANLSVIVRMPSEEITLTWFLIDIKPDIEPIYILVALIIKSKNTKFLPNSNYDFFFKNQVQ